MSGVVPSPSPDFLSLGGEEAREKYLHAGFLQVMPDPYAREAMKTVIAARRAAWEAMDRLRKLVLALDDGNIDVVMGALQRVEDATVSSNGVGGYWQEVVCQAGAACTLVHIGCRA